VKRPASAASPEAPESAYAGSGPYTFIGNCHGWGMIAENEYAQYLLGMRSAMLLAAVVGLIVLPIATAFA
jgi:hypothetical protein